MSGNHISIHRARENNLDNVCVEIPKRTFTVVTGVSGSGKSSLVFDTIFAGCQREYLNSLSAYARQSLPRISPPDVDFMEGLLPAIVIDQRRLGRNPRSTVGTATDAFTFLRLLFSRCGTPQLDAGSFSFNTPSGACEACKGLGVEMKPDLEVLLDKNLSLNQGAIQHRTWKVGSRYHNIIGATGIFNMNIPLKQFAPQDLECLLYSEPVVQENNEPGYVQRFTFEGVVTRLMKRQADARGQEGSGYDAGFFTQVHCTGCNGSRLNQRARSVTVNGKSIVDFVTMEISELAPRLRSMEGAVEQAILGPVVRLLQTMDKVGVGYLTLSRSVATLSSGESQRLRLARQLGSALTEILYVLDEPTVGLHARDVASLVEILKGLREKPSTVLVVEHDKQVMTAADFIVDMGPGAGAHGGKVMASGTVDQLMRSGTPTGCYLAGSEEIQVSRALRTPSAWLDVRNATLHNLCNISVRIPKNLLVCLTGVSGSGKSSLLEVVSKTFPDLVFVDQAPIGASPRSNPLTYVDVFTPIRNIFADVSGQSASLFAFNSEGACPQCQGLGRETMDMHFLGDVQRVCELCHGRRYQDSVLRYKIHNRSIADILDMTIAEVLELFHRNKKIKASLQLLVDVGLGYLRSGQSLDTLSGGERQRIKLAARLTTQGAVYALDEPTSGLHFQDVRRLLGILHRLVDQGNTVIVVEHDIDVIRNADWIIDLGPEGGRHGGRIVAEGPPEAIASNLQSITGRYLTEAGKPAK